MRSRGLVVVLALILATLATVGVFLYSRGVKEEARRGGDLVTVVVSKVDIPTNTDLNLLVADGQFTTLEVPTDAVVQDVVTQVSELENRRNSAYIFAGEQIPVGRIQGGEIPGGQLSIPEGHQAMTIALDAPAAISGALAGGDHVSIFATFTGVSLVKLNKKFEPLPGNTGEDAAPRFDTTVVLVPDVEVLRVIREGTGAGEVPGQIEEQSVSSGVQVILALEPVEAQKLVYALNQGVPYLTLLPPDEEGVQLDPLTAAKILLPGVPAEDNEQQQNGQ
jgi:Flp pilus assembly protein CpaB